jgi:hypothetical protein
VGGGAGATRLTGAWEKDAGAGVAAVGGRRGGARLAGGEESPEYTGVGGWYPE